MSLEQAILDRLEKRNEENARLQNIINDLERSADASSKQERETYDALVAYIQKMRAQIESDRLEREQMQHQIAELKTERDRILEISKNLVPKSALKQAMLEAAELHGALNDAQGEIQNLRAEVPLESTREALKNTVAKLQEATTRADSLATCRDRWMKIAADCGRMDGEDAGEFMARLAQQSAQGVALAVKVEELRVVNIKQEQELEELRSAKSIAKNGIDESYQVKVLNQLGQTIAYKDRQLMVMVSMYKRIKACRDIEDRIAQMMSITSAIDDADNALSQLTA